MKVLVIKGGLSREREVSLKTGAAAVNGLRQAGHEVRELDLQRDPVREIVAAVDAFGPAVAFIALHGTFGEDGRIQAILDCLKVPYTGSGVLASAVALNKLVSKQLFIANKIPTPEYWVFRRGQDVYCLQDIEYPVIVKPWEEGSSIGAGIAANFIELQSVIENALTCDSVLIIEKFHRGRELTVGVIGNRDPLLLPIIEIVPSKEYFDFQTKYTKGLTEYRVPAALDQEIETRIYEYCRNIFEILELRGMARIDLILDEQRNIYFLEANSIPGMTETSLLPKAAAQSGISFSDLVDRIVNYAVADK